MSIMTLTLFPHGNDLFARFINQGTWSGKPARTRSNLLVTTDGNSTTALSITLEKLSTLADTVARVEAGDSALNAIEAAIGMPAESLSSNCTAFGCREATYDYLLSVEEREIIKNSMKGIKVGENTFDLGDTVVGDDSFKVSIYCNDEADAGFSKKEILDVLRAFGYGEEIPPASYLYRMYSRDYANIVGYSGVIQATYYFKTKK